MPRRNILLFPDPILAENIRKLIDKKGISYERFASCCQKSRKAVINWCNEYSSPSAWDLKQICLNYRVSADEMLGLKNKTGLEVGDTIKCSDKEEMVELMNGLAEDDIETDFLYEKDGQKGLWLIVTKIG